MSVVRELFSSHSKLDQKSAVRGLALAFGHQRAGKNLQGEMLSHLRIAVRRGIIENDKGSYSLLCKSIDDYDRAFLKSQFIASLPVAGSLAMKRFSNLPAGWVFAGQAKRSLN